MYYKIEGFIYHNQNDKSDILSIDRVFKHKNPCIARKMCFDAYMSYMDVLYMTIGKEYTTHDQAVIDLADFFVKDKNIKLDEAEPDNFIDIKMIVNKKERKGIKALKKTEGEVIIHSIGSSHHENVSKMMCLDGLHLEYLFYQLNVFPDCEPEIVKDKEGENIYKTPIDFSNYEFVFNY